MSLHWKSYGGINAMEKTNNISVNSLSANYLTLKNAYIGYFSINGELSVSEQTHLNANVYIGGNLETAFDSSIGRNSLIKGNNKIEGNVFIGKFLQVYGNTLINGNLHILQNYEIEKNLKVNGNLINFGLVDRGNAIYNINFTALNTKLGLNANIPKYTLDILSDQEEGFQINTSSSSNKNVIAQNNKGQGIVVTTGNIGSSLHFYNESSMQNDIIADSSITYVGGNLVIDVLNDTKFTSNISIGHRNVNSHIYNETAVIYDNSSDSFLHDIYESEDFHTGSALTLVADNSLDSNTGVNIVTTAGKGIKILGGSYIKGNTRSAGILGIYDISKKILSSQTIVAGNSRVKNRSTVGINTFAPDADNYVMDINGPMKINHSEIVLVQDTSSQINKMVFSENSPNNGIAFGSPVEITNLATSVKSYKQEIFHTQDNGTTWERSYFYQGESNSLTAIELRSGYVHDSKLAFVGGDNGLLLFSSDGYKTWNKIDGINVSTSINAIQILQQTSGDIIVAILFTGQDAFNNNIDIITLGYFIVKDRDTFNNFTGAIDVSTASTTNSIFIINKPYIASVFSGVTQINAVSAINSSYLFIAGVGGIGKILIDGEIIITTVSDLATNLFITITSNIGSNINGFTYNAIQTRNNLPTPLTVAVGDGIISSTKDNGITWTDYLISNVSFKSIYIHSLKYSIAVGKKGEIFATKDSGATWKSIYDSINISGIASLLANSLNTLSSVVMTDDNTFLISSIYKSYVVTLTSSSQTVSTAQSKIFSCYFPDLFNHSNNNILDVYGNMKLSGDIRISDSAYIGVDANIIGNTFANANLYVKQNTHVNGNVSVDGNILAANIYGYQVIYTPQILGLNGNIDIGTTINLNGNLLSIKMNKTVFMYDVSMNSNLHLNNDLNCLGSVNTHFINDISGQILIGTKGGGKTIRISDAVDGGGSDASNPNNVYIGGASDNVTIKGNNLQILGSISTTNSQIQLNSGYTGQGGSAGAGLKIRDYNNDTSGYIQLNPYTDGFVFKSSDIHGNILNLRADDLTIANRYDSITKEPIRNDLVILRDTYKVYNENTWGANICTMTTGWFDVSNVLLGNYMFQGGTPNQQTISTDFGVQGNTIFYNSSDSYNLLTGSLKILGGVSLLGNLHLGGNLNTYNNNTFSGNTRMLGNLNITDNSNSAFSVIGRANFLGDTIMNNNTNILGNLLVKNVNSRFTGNIEFANYTKITSDTDSYALETSALTVSGGASVNGNLFLGGNLDIQGNSSFRNITVTGLSDATYSSGSLQVFGGICVQKNMFVSGNVNIGTAVIVSNTTDSLFLGSGSIITAGGGSIQKNLYVGNTEYIGVSNITEIVPLDILFTSAVQTITGLSTIYKNGNYLIKNSNSDLTFFHDTFNHTPVTNYYWTASHYNINGGYSGIVSTLIDGVVVNGEYLQINLPYSTVLTSYQLSPGSIATYMIPSSWYVCGSNDGSNFFSIDKKINNLLRVGLTSTFFIDNSYTNTAFSIFRIVVTDGFSNDNNVTVISLKKFYLNGYPLPSTASALNCFGASNITGNLYIAGITNFTNYIDSSSTSTGSLLIAGGIGVKGNTFFNNINVNNYLRIGTTKKTSFALDVSGSMNVSGQFNLGNIILTDSTETSQLGTGVLKISNGGASIFGNTFIGGNLNLPNPQSNLIISGNAFVNGTIFSNITSNLITITPNGSFVCRGGFFVDQFGLTSTQESYSTTTGALFIPGGIGILGNLNVGGNINVGQTLTTSGNLNATGYTTISGLLSANGYLTTISGNLLASGSLTTVSGNLTVLGYSRVQNLSIFGSDSFNTYSGALQVIGGAGIGGNIFIKGNTILSKQLILLETIDSSSVGTGTLIVSGGTSISGNCNIGGNTVIYGAFGTTSNAAIPFPPTQSPSNTVYIGTSGTPTLTSVIFAGSQTFTSSITDRTGLLTYQNGTYLMSSGSLPFISSTSNVTFYGSNALIKYSLNPWISSYLYDNITGLPSSVNTTLIQTTAYNYATSISSAYKGDWLQFGFPYQMILSEYTIKFLNTDSSILIEATPASWYILGSIDNVSWYFIQHDTTLTTSTTTFQVINSIPYAYYRFVIETIKSNTSATTGVALPGIFNITYNGIPYLSPFISSIASNISFSPNSVIGVNTNGQLSLPLSGSINAFIGSKSFAGNSTLVNFGDSTTYGNYNLFRNLNILGNINTVRSNYFTSINSDISLYGNINITQNSSFQGTISMNGKVVSNSLYPITSSATKDTITSTGNTALVTKEYVDDAILTLKLLDSSSYVYITGSTMSGKLGILGRSNFPNGWSGGVRTLDLYASGGIAVGDESGNIKNAIYSDGTVSFTGTSAFATTNVSGLLTCSNNLLVSGSSTLATTNVAGILTCSNNLVVSGSSALATTNITGILTCSNNLDVSGSSALRTTYIDGILTINNNLVVAGVPVFNTGLPVPIFSTQGSDHGLRIYWNTITGLGRTDFLNNGQGGSGGFNFFIATSGQVATSCASFENAGITSASFNATSDYRIKQHVRDLDYSFNIDLLHPVTYTNTKTQKTDIGLIAHELQQHYPYLVTGEKDADELQTINYIGLIGILINEIQTIKTKLTSLQNQIDTILFKI